MFFWMAMLLLAAFVAVLIGALLEEPESAIGLIILAIPGLVAVLVRTVTKRAHGKSMGWGDRMLTFFLTSAAIFGIISLLAIAAFVALFIYCVIALKSQGQF